MPQVAMASEAKLATAATASVAVALAGSALVIRSEAMRSAAMPADHRHPEEMQIPSPSVVETRVEPEPAVKASAEIHLEVRAQAGMLTAATLEAVTPRVEQRLVALAVPAETVQEAPVEPAVTRLWLR